MEFNASSVSTPTPAVSSIAPMSPGDQCESRRQWYLFLASSLGVWAGGLSIVLIHRFLRRLLYKASRYLRKPDPQELPASSSGGEDYGQCRPAIEAAEIGWLTEAKDWAGELISGQTTTGRILVMLVFALNIASWIVYLVDTGRVIDGKHRVEVCEPWFVSVSQQIDLAFNVIFLIYFFIRFLAAQDKVWFWVDGWTVVDVLTIPPSFLSISLERAWLGFRFMRITCLASLTDVLQYLDIMKSASSIRLTQLVTLFANLVLTTAGFIYLVENTGDPPTYSNAQPLTFFQCSYYMIVTMPTVGYGDIACKTTIGRAFMAVFILGGLAVFANSIPEIADILGSRSKYGGSYKKENGKQHIVVCGHITYETVSHFLGDFLHEDREDVDVQILLLDKHVPDLELQGLLKRHFTQVEFFQGSVMSSKDLQRAALESADACLVLSNKYCCDPDAEDAANIMRVISIKNYCAEIKVIIQLMQYHNKAYLLNIPSWDWKRGDDAVCLAELKLGFLAQSCLSPGFSTLLANLFTMRSFKDDGNQPRWLSEYMEGAGMEMYTEYLSPAFEGMSFPEAAEFCFVKLNLLLIAVEVKSEDGSESCIAINPKKNVNIDQGTQGFFIAQSAEDVKKVFYYCKACHEHLLGVNCLNIKSRCNCKQSSRFYDSLYGLRRKTSTTSSSGAIGNTGIKRSSLSNGSTTTETVMARGQRSSGRAPSLPGVKVVRKSRASLAIAHGRKIPGLGERKFDSTGMFHWCEERVFEEAILDRDQIAMTVFSGHIVVCLFADAGSPLIGLRNFVMPLRASNFHSYELKHVIFVGSADYMRREWRTLMNFPKISILPGSPLNRANLRSVNINLCDMCVILSSKLGLNIDDPTLVDKEAILCSLNIKAMFFDAVTSIEDDPAAPKEMNQTSGNLIPMLTELSIDENSQFLDQDDDDDPDVDLFMTQPFACGTAFAASVLDSLMSTAYFNENALTLIRTLITGGHTPELEQILAEGSGIRGGFSTPETLANRDRCHVTQMAVTDGLLETIPHPDDIFTYGQMFRYALHNKGILSIGVYRYIQDPEDYGTRLSHKRYVITNPPSEFQLFLTDRIFCLRPYVERDRPPISRSLRYN